MPVPAGDKAGIARRRPDIDHALVELILLRGERQDLEHPADMVGGCAPVGKIGKLELARRLRKIGESEAVTGADLR